VNEQRNSPDTGASPLVVDVLTLFPEVFPAVFGASILGRAQREGRFLPRLVDIRDFTTDRHRTVDDEPYGGGSGMVLKVEPIFRALTHVLGGEEAYSHWAKAPRSERQPPVVLFTPQGRRFTQAEARRLARFDHLVFLCGHYEGVDERVRENLVSEEISLGDFVLTGGELGAMLVVDAVVRLRPGVLGNEYSFVEESFSEGLLEYPQYTRPPEFRGWEVPEILRSGDHEAIARWRQRESLRRTLERRPDLLLGRAFSREEVELLAELAQMSPELAARVRALALPPLPSRKRRAGIGRPWTFS